MSDKDQNKDQKNKDQGDRSPQVGALLRASRLRVGEDLRDVSDILCIRYLYLEAIEECRYSDLPGNTYAVGFIRSYAEHLGLDGDEVVRRYRLEQTGKRGATDLAFPTPVPDSGVPKGAIVFIGVLIALLVYGGWYVTTTDESILSDLISPVPDHLKHLVTGDDAPRGAAPESETPAEGADAPAAADQNAADVEKVVRETTQAAEQMADAAGEAAQRTAEAAAEAAATASEAVSEQTQAAATAATGSTSDTATTPASDTPAATPVVSPPATDAAASAPASVADTATIESAVSPAGSSAESEPQPAPSTSAAMTESTETAMAAPETASAPSGEASPASTETASSEATVPTSAASTAAVESGTSTTQSTPGGSADTQAPSASENATPESGTETETAAATAAPAATPAPAASSSEVTAEDLNKLVLRQAAGNAGAANPSSVTTPPPPETASTGSAASVSGIVIRATSSSWVEVRNPNTSTVLFTGLMSAGDTFNVPDTAGLILDTGNAGALTITIDGDEVPALGGFGAVRKNVSLDAGRLKAGTATGG